MKIEENILIAEFLGYKIKPNVADWSEFNDQSLTEHWNNNDGTFVHVPKGKGQKWYKVLHRGTYYQLYTDFTFSKLDANDIEMGFELADQYILFKDCKYKTSWDWLMIVIEDILNVCSEMDELERYHVIIDNIPQIDHTYDEVIKFINWYNEEKEEEETQFEKDVKNGLYGDVI